MEEKEIIKKVLGGEIDVFSKLVQKYEKRIISYCYGIGGSEELAEDASQNTFIKAYKNLAGFDQNKKFSSWLFTIAHNETVNLIKKEKFNLSLDLAEWIHEIIPGKTNLEEETIDEEKKNMVAKCLKNLKLIYREPVYLYFVAENSYGEISEILGIPASTVGVRIKRGKELLVSICTNEKQK